MDNEIQTEPHSGQELSKQDLDNATIIVTNAGLAACNGTYKKVGKIGSKRWDNQETGAWIQWWSTSCGWELYYQRSFTCKYWTKETEENTYPWQSEKAKWIVRPGNEGIDPPPTVIAQCEIGSKLEQDALADFLTQRLRIPPDVAQLPWLHVVITLR